MGHSAQQRLAEAKITLVGVGGTGTACATYLAGAGIGCLVLIDPGHVQWSDLNRQILYTPEDIGSPKVSAAAKQLVKFNPSTKVETIQTKLDAHNADDLIKSSDLIIDGLDHWQDKILLSDVCMQLEIPLVHAGVLVYNFQIYTMVPNKSACLRCVFARLGLEDPPSSAEERGVPGPVAGMAGAMQAMEAIKLLSNAGPLASSHLIKFDTLRRNFDDIVDLTPSSDCPDCGMRRA